MFTSNNNDWFNDIISRYAITDYEGLIKPAFGTGSIADIPGILKQNLGLTPRRPVPELLRGAARDVDHMIFFLMDGFGHSTLEYTLGDYKATNLRKFLEYSDYTPVTSVFPSTTSTATVTYQTDLSPLEHGIIGYNAYISELGSVCNMITLTPVGRNDYSLLDHGWKVPAIEHNGTIYEEFGRNSLESYHYLPSAIKGSGMTRITSSGATVNGYYSISQMLTSLRRDVERSKGKSFHLCYIPNVDTISHKIGPYTEETALEIESIFHLINEQFLENVNPSGTLGVGISADHGHTVIRTEDIFDVQEDRKLVSMMRAPVAGDFRAPIMRIKPGYIEQAMEHLEQNYGTRYIIRSGSDMISDGFYGEGELDWPLLDRFGDIVLIPKEKVGIRDSSLGILDRKLDTFDLIGMHGGLSPEEMIVPFIFKTMNGRR